MSSHGIVMRWVAFPYSSLSTTVTTGHLLFDLNVLHHWTSNFIDNWVESLQKVMGSVAPLLVIQLCPWTQVHGNGPTPLYLPGVMWWTTPSPLGWEFPQLPGPQPVSISVKGCLSWLAKTNGWPTSTNFRSIIHVPLWLGWPTAALPSAQSGTSAAHVAADDVCRAGRPLINNKLPHP